MSSSTRPPNSTPQSEVLAPGCSSRLPCRSAPRPPSPAGNLGDRPPVPGVLSRSERSWAANPLPDFSLQGPDLWAWEPAASAEEARLWPHLSWSVRQHESTCSESLRVQPLPELIDAGEVSVQQEAYLQPQGGKRSSR